MYRKAKIKMKAAFLLGTRQGRRQKGSPERDVGQAFWLLLYHLQRAEPIHKGDAGFPVHGESRKGKRDCSKKRTYLTWKMHTPLAPDLVPGPHLAVRLPHWKHSLWPPAAGKQKNMCTYSEVIARIGHTALFPFNLYPSAPLFGQLANVWLPPKTSGSTRIETKSIWYTPAQDLVSLLLSSWFSCFFFSFFILFLYIF